MRREIQSEDWILHYSHSQIFNDQNETRDTKLSLDFCISHFQGFGEQNGVK